MHSICMYVYPSRGEGKGISNETTVPFQRASTQLFPLRDYIFITVLAWLTLFVVAFICYEIKRE